MDLVVYSGQLTQFLDFTVKRLVRITRRALSSFDGKSLYFWEISDGVGCFSFTLIEDS